MSHTCWWKASTGSTSPANSLEGMWNLTSIKLTGASSFWNNNNRGRSYRANISSFMIPYFVVHYQKHSSLLGKFRVLYHKMLWNWEGLSYIKYFGVSSCFHLLSFLDHYKRSDQHIQLSCSLLCYYMATICCIKYLLCSATVISDRQKCMSYPFIYRP